MSSAFACTPNATETNKNASVAQKEKPVANEAKKTTVNNSPAEESKKEERVEIWDGRIGASLGNKPEPQKFSAKEREMVANAVSENLDKIKKLLNFDISFICIMQRLY